MADISTHLKQIESSERGEDVRTAIIETLKILNEGATVQRLNGKSSSELLTKTEFETIAPLLDHVDKNSEKGVQSKGISAELDKVTDALNDCVNRESVLGNFDDAIYKARTSINGMADAIRNHGIDLKSDASLSQFADAIDSITTGSDGEYQLGTLNATENKTYSAADPEYTSGGNNKVAWNQVDVNVTPNTAQKTISSLTGTYGKWTANSDKDVNDGKKVDGYSSVKVNISNQFPELNLNDSLLPDTPEELASTGYSASEKKLSDGSSAIGFSKVKMDLDGRFAPLEIEVDMTNPGDTEYIAANDDGFDTGGDLKLYGYSKVHFKIKENDGPFTVRFYNGNTLMYEVNNVRKNQTVIYKGKKPTKDGWTFDRWEPKPDKVTYDMDCCAIFVRGSSSKKKVDSDNNIIDNWEEILSDGGADYPIGSTKQVIAEECVFRYEGGVTITVPRSAYVMMKVGEGEDGTTASWLSTTPIPVSLYFDGPWNNSEGKLVFNGDVSTLLKSIYGWETSKIFENLNGVFLMALANPGLSSSYKQDSLASHIRPVDKWTVGYSPYYNGPTLTKKKCSIWIPSDGEINGELSQYESAFGMFTYKTDDFTPPHPLGTGYRTATGGSKSFMATYDRHYQNSNPPQRQLMSKNVGNGFQLQSSTEEGNKNGKILSATYTLSNCLGYGGTDPEYFSTAYTGAVMGSFQFGFCT